MFRLLITIVFVGLALSAAAELRLQNAGDSAWIARVDTYGCILGYEQRDHPHDVSERRLDISIVFLYLVPGALDSFEFPEFLPTSEDILIVMLRKAEATPRIVELSIPLENGALLPMQHELHDNGTHFYFAQPQATEFAAGLDRESIIEIKYLFEDEQVDIREVDTTLYKVASAMYEACKENI